LVKSRPITPGIADEEMMMDLRFCCLLFVLIEGPWAPHDKNNFLHRNPLLFKKHCYGPYPLVRNKRIAQELSILSVRTKQHEFARTKMIVVRVVSSLSEVASKRFRRFSGE
jgi:hypothetical protein